MGAFPSAAAQVKPFDPFEYRSKALQIQQQQQSVQSNDLAIQQQQRDQKDQEAVRQTLAKHQGDLDAALPELAGTVSAKTFMGLDQFNRTRKKEALEVDEKTRTAKLAQNDQLMGVLSQADALAKQDPNSYLQAFPQLAASAIAAKPELAKVIDPNKPIPIEELDKFRIGIMTDSVFEKKAAEARATAKASQETISAADAHTAAVAELPGKTAASALKQKEVDVANAGGAVPGIALDVQEANSWLKNNPGKTLADYKKYASTLVPVTNFNLQNAGATGQSGQPSEMAKSIANGEMKWNDVVSVRTPMKVKEELLAQVKQLNPQFNSGDFTVEQKVREKFTSGNVSDQLMAINTAREHMKTFRAVAAALVNGNVQALNKLGNSIGVQFGSDKATNFKIAAQAFGGEVGRAFDGAGVVAGERKEAQDNFNTAMSNGQFGGAIDIVDKLLAGKQKSAKDTYSQTSTGKPMFGDKTGGGLQVGAPVTVKGKQMKVTAVHPDGSFDAQ